MFNILNSNRSSSHNNSTDSYDSNDNNKMTKETFLDLFQILSSGNNTNIIIIVIIIAIIIIIIIIIKGSLPSSMVEKCGEDIFRNASDNKEYIDINRFKQLVSAVDVDTNLTCMY